MIMDKKLVDEISKITITDYEPYNTKREGKVLIDNEGILCMLEDLLAEIDRLNEHIEDMRDYYESHYRYVKEKYED